MIGDERRETRSRSCRVLLAVQGYVHRSVNPQVGAPCYDTEHHDDGDNGRDLAGLALPLDVAVDALAVGGTGNVVGSRRRLVNVRDILARMRTPCLPSCYGLLVVLIAGGIVVWGCEMMRMGLFCIIPVPMSCHGLVRSVAASIVLAPVYPSFNIHELRISRKYGMNNVMG